MKPLLENLKKRGFIEKEPIGFDQIEKHLRRAHKDLKAAKANLKIDSEVAYNYSYLAMLRAGRALVFSFGYRPIDGQQHKTVVRFCEIVLGEEFNQLVSRFDRMRKFRNKFTYDEPDVLVSRQQTEKSLESAGQLVKVITKLIQGKNPQKKLL